MSLKEGLVEEHQKWTRMWPIRGSLPRGVF